MSTHVSVLARKKKDEIAQLTQHHNTISIKLNKKSQRMAFEQENGNSSTDKCVNESNGGKGVSMSCGMAKCGNQNKI